MSMTIDNDDVVRLADEVAELTGESRTDAIRRALVTFRGRLRPSDARRVRLEALVAQEMWPGARKDRPRREP